MAVWSRPSKDRLNARPFLSTQERARRTGTAGLIKANVTMFVRARPVLSNRYPNPNAHTHPKHAAVKWNIKASVISLQAGTGADPKTRRGIAREVEKKKEKRERRREIDSEKETHLNEGLFTQKQNSNWLQDHRTDEYCSSKHC